MYKIILANGYVLDDLRKEISYYVSDKPIDQEVLKDNLYRIEISHDGIRNQLKNMKLVSYYQKENGETGFAIESVSEMELEIAKIRSNLDYIAMMTGVNILK